MSLTGRVGLVTGAGRGLGRELATSLAAEGMSLALVSRTGEQVRALGAELSERYGVAVLPAAIDVGDHAAVQRVVLHVEQQLGTVDLLVNNAARIEGSAVPFWEADVEQVWGVVETNLRGPMLLSHALLPAMVARGHGRIVNLASRARAATRTGHYTGYAVSKRALSLLTESLAPGLVGTGVTVVDVLPGLVRTGLTLSMPVWAEVTAWDDSASTARVVTDIARGRYDAAHGTVLDAPALDALARATP